MNGWLKRVLKIGLTYKEILLLVVLSLTATATEVFGIGIFLPIFQFIRLGDLNALVSDSGLWIYVINGFNYFSLEPSLVALLLLSFTFFLGRQFFTYIRLIYNAAVTQRLTQIQRNRMFNAYIEADNSYHDNIPVGNLVNVITTEVSGAVTGVMAPMELMVYTIMLFGYLSVLFLLSWQMTLVSAIVLLLAARISNIWIKKSAHTGRKLVDANVLMSEFLVGRLRAPRLVRLAGTELAEKNEFHQLTHAQRKHSVYSSILQTRTDVAMEPVVIGLSLVFLYFAYTVLQLQIEVIGLYLVIALRLMPTVKGIISQWQSVQRYLGSIEIIENRLSVMKDSVEKDIGMNSLISLNETVLFDKVSYRYPKEKNYTLKNISIEFKVSEMTALVGPSGSGKSTLIDLLPRLRVPQAGSIYVDHHPIGEYTLSSLRQAIAYAPQSPQIFDGSVSNHIRYGKYDATDEEIREAAKLAGADKFIDQLPDGYDTLLGEDAVNLSGGQRQRLDLARALVRNASILILDEPTSNLDAESEEAFRQALRRIRNETETTIIIVAHRLASVVDADQIVVLNQGRVDAIGNHVELISQDGWYLDAWVLQGGSLL